MQIPACLLVQRALTSSSLGCREYQAPVAALLQSASQHNRSKSEALLDDAHWAAGLASGANRVAGAEMACEWQPAQQQQQ